MTPQELLGSVISLAVQGKLVPQLEVEGSADPLYNHLVNQKLILIKQGLVKKSKTLSPISEDEKLFKIPNSWRWIKLGEISSVITKGTTPRGGNVSYLDAGIGFLRAENVAGLDKLDKSNLKYIDEETHLDYLKRSILEAHDILITIAGTLGRTAIVREEDLPLNANQAVSVVRLVDSAAIDLTYLVYSLNSPEIQRYLTKQRKVTAIPNLTLEIIENCLVPLPPVAEQKRIVAKLEEILPLIDRYETAWNKLEAFNKRFPGDMQKSILQLAIQGKLVEQRPEEGTGEELFQQIQAEKQNLIKDGKTKKEKPLPEISDDEIPFDIPSSWKWVRFSDLMDSMSTGPFGSTLHKSDYVENGIPLVNPANIVNGRIVASDKMMVSKETAKRLESYVLKTGMIIMGRRGEMGRCAVVGSEENGWLCGTGSFFMMPSTCMYVHFLSMFFATPYAKAYLSGASVGTTMSNLNHKILSNMPVPLPPVAEQKRIVARLKEILPLSDRLK